jgi:hypothetical protein
MKTHKWILPVVMQARIGPAGSPTGVTRTDPPGRAARGILILALVLGGLGAEGAIASGHGTGDHASAHYAAGNNRPGASAYLTSSGHARFNAWMY